MTTRYERLKMQRRMQRRIRLVVEERRMALARRPTADEEEPSDADTTMEIPSVSTPAPTRAIGRVIIGTF